MVDISGDLNSTSSSISGALSKLSGLAAVLSVLTLGVGEPSDSPSTLKLAGGSSTVSWCPDTALSLAASPASDKVVEQSLALLKSEASIARRLLEIVDRVNIQAGTAYVRDLRGTLAQVPDGDLQLVHCAPLASRLQEARVRFESALSALPEWLLLAKTIKPELAGGAIRVPERFVRRQPVSDDVPFMISESDVRVAEALRATFGSNDADPRPS